MKIQNPVMMEEKGMTENGAASYDIIVTQILHIWRTGAHRWRRNPAERAADGIGFVLSGELRYDFPDGSVTACPGDAVILPRGVRYGGEQIGGAAAQFLVVDFETAPEASLFEFCLPHAVHLQDARAYEVRMERMLERWKEQRVDSSLRCRTMLYELLLALTEEGMPAVGGHMQEILAFIGDNLHRRELGVPMLCAAFFVSESQLRRDFRRATGLSPADYIRTRRLERAAGLLEAGTHNAAAAAAACGFATPYYFSKCFHDHFGMPPSRFIGRSDI